MNKCQVHFAGSFRLLRTTFADIVKGRFLILGRTMSWEIEKNLTLGSPLEERRKRYKVTPCTLDDVPTWKDECAISRPPPPLERDRTRFGDFRIRSELNGQLSDKVSVWSGDITRLEIDSIVNAANSALKGGGGVDGAIHRAAGSNLLDECKSIGGCPTGEARITGGYLLPAKYVIHTVGPTNKSKDLLTSCYKSCFALIKAESLKSVAFPCIGTGIYNFPNVEAAHIACAETRKFLEEDVERRGGTFQRIIFCVFENKDLEIYRSVAQLYFPVD